MKGRFLPFLLVFTLLSITFATSNLNLNERDGYKTYILQLTDKNNNTLMVELSADETYWNINTAGIFRTSYGAKKKVVYNRHATDKQSAETVEASLSGE